MATLREFRQKLKNKNQNRLRYLKEKFNSSSQDKMKPTVAEEVQGILNVNELMDHEIGEDRNLRGHVGIRSSAREIWYRDVMIAWLKQHPESGVDTDKSASLYRFALEFFVNQIILNPKNNPLSYAQLLTKMDQLNDVDPMLAAINFQLETKMEDIKELVSFISAMEYLENMTVFGPSRQIDEVIQPDIRSELDESSQYYKDYVAYQERRKHDLANKRQRHTDEGMEFSHD
ncbi:hypothetical protein [Weissella paramesenteroides]|uniref:hypothetical protein n=1 Tax=Weissella paramesenteroides TaxID=1249 RepID=UPI00388EBAB2